MDSTTAKPDFITGFTELPILLSHGKQKLLRATITARVAAVAAYLEHGPSVSLAEISNRVGESERNLRRRFPQKTALVAFPPPELAAAIGTSALTATNLSRVFEQVRPVFEALDTNPVGKQLLADLVRLHARHPSLACSDGYFLAEIRSIVANNLERTRPKALELIGYFTEGVRSAIIEWSRFPEQSTIMIAEAIQHLVSNPVPLQEGNVYGREGA